MLLEVEARVAAEPSVIEAQRKWATCMADKGFAYPTEQAASVAARDRFQQYGREHPTVGDEGLLEQIRSEERATAVADFDCFEEFQADVEAAVRPAIEQKVLAENPWLAEAVDVAKRDYEELAGDQPSK